MFWDSINSDLFKPLASANSKVYSIALFSLYEHLIVNQTEIGECTPVNAKEVIRSALLEHDQHVNWEVEDDAEVLFSDEPDEAGRIYRRLRDCGWLREMDGEGYRKETFMPRIAASLISALENISHGPVSRLGSTCQGIFSAIRTVRTDPNNGVANIEFAANCARTFYKDLSAMASSCQEVAYAMREEHSGNKLFETFFEEFLKKILLVDYSKLNLISHPYRYRLVTIEEVYKIKESEDIWQVLISKHHKEYETPSLEESEKKVSDDLDDINRILVNIDILLKRIEHYRSTMTRRTREAMQYALTAVPQLGKRLDNLIDIFSKMPEGSDGVPSRQLTESYVSLTRLYQPKVKSIPAEPTLVQKLPPSFDAIAKSRALDEYIRRRAPSPRRIIKIIEKAMGDKQRVTSDDLKVESLEDFIAFLQLRDLLHDAVPKSSPYSLLIKLYECRPIPDEYTENEFVIAPKILIERRVQLSTAKEL
jgi:hypothetical protein